MLSWAILNMLVELGHLGRVHYEIVSDVRIRTMPRSNVIVITVCQHRPAAGPVPSQQMDGIQVNMVHAVGKLPRALGSRRAL